MLNILYRIIRLSGKRKKKIITGMLASVLEAITTKISFILILFVLIKILDKSLTMKDIYILSAALAGDLILGCIFNYFGRKNLSVPAYELFGDERLKLGDRIKRFAMGYFTDGNIGDLTAVVTSDIKFIEEFGAVKLGDLVSTLFASGVVLIMLCLISTPAAIVTMIAYVPCVFFFRRLQKIAKTCSQESQETQKNVVGGIIEYMKGMEVIKAFSLTGNRHKKIINQFEEFKNAQISFSDKFTVPLMYIEIITAIAIGTIIYLSANAAVTNPAYLAYLLLFAIMAFEIFKPINSLSSVSADIRLMEAALNRYEKAMNTEKICDEGTVTKIDRFDIEFNQVSFSYDKKEILHNMSFIAKEKSLTALVGKSGCGKTTVTSLIARFWDVNKGEILIGGKNIKEISFAILMEKISMVFQNVYLFNDSIFNNIAFGNKNATKEEVIEAAKKARCYDFIMEYDDGFDTTIGEGGASLSGGEKQRISIARAILKDAPIVLLDEATASVDPDNENLIQEAISELIAYKTIIVIAHKLSTIKNADTILVIDDGRIIDRGKHIDLVQKEGLYKTLWEKREKSKTWKIERKKRD
jgi:ATP-binding cassette subfamily B protein IrtB